MNVYDLGNITKYQLSKYLKKQKTEAEDVLQMQQNSFSYLH